LSEDERVLIADRIRAGASLRAIGRYLGRPASTVFAVVPQTAAVPRYDPTC
jgi:IS30 family transposase